MTETAGSAVSLDRMRQANAPEFDGALAALSLFPESQFEAVLVRGPNRRNDFHVDPYDELFLQLEGTIRVDTRAPEEGLKRHLIREGEVFVVPAAVPHSPLRPAGTWGMVVEIRRRPGDIEAAEWYCDKCDALIERVEMESSQIIATLTEVVDKFQASDERRTCKACGYVLPVPGEFALDGSR